MVEDFLQVLCGQNDFVFSTDLFYKVFLFSLPVEIRVEKIFEISSIQNLKNSKGFHFIEGHQKIFNSLGGQLYICLS